MSDNAKALADRLELFWTRDQETQKMLLRDIRGYLRASPVIDRDDKPCRDCEFHLERHGIKCFRHHASSGEPERGAALNFNEQQLHAAGFAVNTLYPDSDNSRRIARAVLRAVFPSATFGEEQQVAALTPLAENYCPCGHDAVEHDRDPDHESWCGFCPCKEFRAALDHGDR